VTCIEASKEAAHHVSIIKASNSATILNAARFSFSGLDLHSIKIPGANLINGIFHRTNLSLADLSNCKLAGACFN